MERKESKRALVKRAYGFSKGSKLKSELFGKKKVEEITLENRPRI